MRATGAAACDMRRMLWSLVTVGVVIAVLLLDLASLPRYLPAEAAIILSPAPPHARAAPTRA
jgi:hypothetical protein